MGKHNPGERAARNGNVPIPASCRVGLLLQEWRKKSAEMNACGKSQSASAIDACRESLEGLISGYAADDTKCPCDEDRSAAGEVCTADNRSPLERLIDAATGYTPAPQRPPEASPEQQEVAKQIGRDVVSNLRVMYPDVLKNAPSTLPIHLRNTIASEVERALKNQGTPANDYGCDCLVERPTSVRRRRRT